MSASVPIAKSRPVNDLHNTPGICADSKGTLHVVTGAHGWPFRYVHSTAPVLHRRVDAADQRHAQRVPGQDHRQGRRRQQTYLSLVCAPDDTLHVVCRQVRRRTSTSTTSSRGTTRSSHTSLAPGASAWSTPDLVVVPPQAGYSQYYQKLTVDRLGRLFVSCSYFSRRDPPATRTFRRFHHRMVLISEDGGRTWRFVTTADFLAGIPAGVEPAAAGRRRQP